MSKIFTYLIGAGASCQDSLPTIKNFNSRLSEYKNKFKNRSFTAHKIPGIVSDIRSLVVDFVTDLEWLVEEIDNHSSVDTFARKLYLTQKKEDYQFLKFLVSDFLTHEQLVMGLDKRYDAFFAAILRLNSLNEVEFPANVRFLSWNYDKQIEFSAAQFKPNTNTLDDEINLFPRKGDNKSINNGFSVYKLNGTIGGIIEKEDFSSWQFDPLEIGNKLDDKGVENLMLKSLARHFQYKALQTFNSSIHYSWENNKVSNLTRQKAIEGTINTDVLIVIGYSFPTFNRKLDSQILNRMNNRLQKIYIQDTNAEAVKQKLESLLTSQKTIVTLKSTDEFYIPFDFTS